VANVEKQARKIAKRAKVQQALVLALYGGVVLPMAVFAPNAMRLLKNLDPDLSKKRKPAYRIQQALKRLENRDLIRREKTEKGLVAKLTPRGKKFAERLNAAHKIYIRKPRKWDGRWRIVIFDIWERRRGVRDQLRRILAKAGFKKLQNSVWIYPYDCEELLTLIRTDLRLGKSILYIVAEGVENDLILRRLFDLPLN
jgi:DNA-binding transcriptional regulator PaaX